MCAGTSDLSHWQHGFGLNQGTDRWGAIVVSAAHMSTMRFTFLRKGQAGQQTSNRGHFAALFRSEAPSGLLAAPAPNAKAAAKTGDAIIKYFADRGESRIPAFAGFGPLDRSGDVELLYVLDADEESIFDRVADRALVNAVFDQSNDNMTALRGVPYSLSIAPGASRTI